MMKRAIETLRWLLLPLFLVIILSAVLLLHISAILRPRSVRMDREQFIEHLRKST